jgi:hypothetical protein
MPIKQSLETSLRRFNCSFMLYLYLNTHENLIHSIKSCLSQSAVPPPRFSIVAKLARLGFSSAQRSTIWIHIEDDVSGIRFSISNPPDSASAATPF